MNNADTKLVARMIDIGNSITALLDGIAGEHMGFVLITLPINRDGKAHSIQNVPSDVALAVMRGQARILETLTNTTGARH